MKTLILVALDVEIGDLAPLKKSNVDIVITGVGKANACYHLGKHFNNHDLVVSIGTGGGLKDDMYIGQVIYSTKHIEHDMSAEALGFKTGLTPFQHQPSDSIIIDTATSSADKFNNSNVSASGDSFISQQQQLELKSLGVVVVDMESAALAKMCYFHCQRPFINIRVISDVVGKKCSAEQWAKNIDLCREKIREIIASNF